MLFIQNSLKTSLNKIDNNFPIFLFFNNLPMSLLRQTFLKFLEYLKSLINIFFTDRK